MSAGAEGAVVDRDAAAALAGQGLPDVDRIVRGLEALEEARELVERNVNPQLIAANLQRLGPQAGLASGQPAEAGEP